MPLPTSRPSSLPYDRFAGWPDALAFAIALAVAYYAEWSTRDLIWSLWLSSLVVGVAIILWSVTRRGTHEVLVRQRLSGAPRVVTSHVISAFVVGVLTLVAYGFFFGIFHFVHAQWLIEFFPMNAGDAQRRFDLSTYTTAFQRYWHFLPSAFLAERAAFTWSRAVEVDDGSVTAEAIERRKERQLLEELEFWRPYRKVLRLHLLIFFFAIMSTIAVDHFVVYAVVYAVYFFPWRILRRREWAMG